MRLTYHPHFMCSSFPQSFFNATLTFFRLVIHFSPFYFFSTSFLLLYNNILLKAALAWRTYFHPPEFLVAGPIPFFCRPPLQLLSPSYLIFTSNFVFYSFISLIIINIATTTTFYSSVYSSLNLSLHPMFSRLWQGRIQRWRCWAAHPLPPIHIYFPPH